jgi:hypothetical protein
VALQEHRRHRSLICASCAVALLSIAQPAQAWTRARVETAVAHVDLQAGGEMRVALELGIRVAGGWLTNFELTGLESELALDPEQPAYVQCADGSTLVPTTKSRGDGRLLFSFADKKTAPHRGLHRLHVAYRTTLSPVEAKRANAIPFSWSLPAWQDDLLQADIWISAAQGARFAADAEPDMAVEHELSQEGARTVLHFHRARLPRSLVFSADFELPAGSAGTALARRQASHGPSPAFYAAALVLALAWLKRCAAINLAARRRVRPLPLLALAASPRAIAMLACALLAARSYAAQPNLGLALLAAAVMLALDRGFAPATPAAPETARPIAHPASELFATAAWFDATTPLGAGLLGSAYALAVQRLWLGAEPGLWLETLLLVTPLWLTATRLHVAADSDDSTVAPDEPAHPPEAAPAATPALLTSDADRRAPGRAA